MQKRRLSVKLISLLLTLSFLISAFSVFAFADESDTDASSGLNVVYNRTFSEGWDYDNGISSFYTRGNQLSLGYEYRGSAYNYFLKAVKKNTDVAFAHIDTTGLLDTDGKTFIEFDIASSLNNAMGQAVRISIQGDIKTLVEFKDDGMYILGTNVGKAEYAMKWESVYFEIDFDYGKNTDGASEGQYLITAYFNGKSEALASRVYNAGLLGHGVTQVRFAFGNTLEDNIGSWYAIDNLKLYSGVDTFAELEQGDYGSAVDSTLKKNYAIAGSSHVDGYIRGEYDLIRQNEDDDHRLVVHYNRTFDEGWTLDQASSRLTTKHVKLSQNGNNIDIRSEKDANGNYNHFMRFRALNTLASGLSVKLPECRDDEPIYIEFDLKTGVNTDLGGILKLTGTSTMWLLGIEDGQLVICGDPVGYIGSDWTHIAVMFDPYHLTMTLYYGDSGVYEGKIDSAFNSITFGQEGGSKYDSFGDWYCVDNLQVYSRVEQFTSLNDKNYGLAVDATAKFDFDLKDASLPDTPVSPDGPGDSGITAGKPTTPPENNDVLSGAPTLDRVELDENSYVHYNRHYGEGWDFAVGGGIDTAGIMQLQNEQNVDLSYNYYQYYEIVPNSDNAYWNFSGTGLPTDGKIFIELDIKASEDANFGGVWQMRPLGGSSHYLLGFKDGYLTGYYKEQDGAKAPKLGKISDEEWVHVAIEIDFDYAKNSPSASSENVCLISYYYGDNLFAAFEHDSKGTFGLNAASAFRIGLHNQAAEFEGQFWCMDNVKVYAGTSTFANIPEDNYGALINPSTTKDFPIQAGGTTFDEMIASSLFLKLNSNYTLQDGERMPALENADGEAYGAPLMINKKVWVPVDTILNYLSYPIYITEDGQSFAISTGVSVTYITLGRDTAVVGGEKVVLKDAPAVVTDNNGNEYLAATIETLSALFPEFYVKLDNMNMITFTKHKDLAADGIADSIKLGIMKDFLFNYISADEIYELAKETTNNFDHPYILANGARFNDLADAYARGKLNMDSDKSNDDATADMELYNYIDKIVIAATKLYIDYANGYKVTTKDYDAAISAFNDGLAYDGLKSDCYMYTYRESARGLQMPFANTNGYDPGKGQLEPPYRGGSKYTADYSMAYLGYAYQVTGDERYAALAYDWAEALVDWDHWGPAHFLDTADTAAAVATTYDWCYDGWVSLGLNVDKIADGLYYHGALQGYLYTMSMPDPHGKPGGSSSSYTTMDNNWNPVCTSGMACAAFAVLGYTGFTDTSALASDYARSKASEWGGDKMTEVLVELVSRNFKSLVDMGVDIYAPDGAYEEGVSYWAYGANNLFRYAAILECCLGSDLGVMDTWGLDRTAYSIMHMVTSDYEMFAYNDCALDKAMNSGWFNYLAKTLNDNTLQAIRKIHIEQGGLEVDFVDSLYYTKIEENTEPELPLQYHHVGIHGYTVRSSWDRGAIFAGLLGGDNDDHHGHIDAGQWVYYSDGISWIQDIGPDNYQSYNYFGNNHMYKTNPEGHNVMVLTSMQDTIPAGQLRSSISPITKVYDDEHGAYTIVDTLPAYSSKAMLSSQRGMLFTNDRKTVVIQDEVTPNGSQIMYWFAHYNVQKVAGVPSVITKVEISSNGRTAKLYAESPLSGETVCLRLAIVSPLSTGITFGTMTAADRNHPEDFVLDATQRYGYSESLGKGPESERDMWNKLFIKFDNLYTINIAIVIEVIDEKDPVAIGYKWTEMNYWQPYADTRSSSGGSSTATQSNRGTAKDSNLPSYAQNLNKKLEAGTLFDDVNDYYKLLTEIKYVVDTKGRDKLSRYDEYLEMYDELLLIYENYYNKIATTTAHIKAIRTALLGVKSETDTED